MTDIKPFNFYLALIKVFEWSLCVFKETKAHNKVNIILINTIPANIILCNAMSFNIIALNIMLTNIGVIITKLNIQEIICELTIRYITVS